MSTTHPFGTAYAMRTDPLRVLAEIQRLAVELLGSVPGALFGSLEEALNPAADAGQRSQYADQNALRLLRQRHAAHVMNFRQQVAQGFDQFRSRRTRIGRDLPLGLLDEAQLEFHLAGQRLAEAIEQRYSGPLQTMDGRLRSLGLEIGLPQAINPIGPARLVAAFMQTFGDESIPESLRILMFGQYELQLSGVLGDLYGKVNTVLSASGYAVAEAKAKATLAGAATAASADAATGATAAWAVAEGGELHYCGSDAGGSDRDGALASGELGELRELLHAWRAGSPKNRPTEPPRTHATGARHPAARRELRVEELVSVASLLQSEPSDTFARALASSGRLGGAIRDQLDFGSRRLGLDPAKTRLSVDEDDAIDLIALLFDSLFQSHRLPERSRRVYARLVLPFVKVALTDPSLFVEAAHPARRLLDAITEACAGNNAETPQERELLERSAAAAQRIVSEYNEDLAIFEVARSELDALLQQQRRRVEMQQERAAQATSGRERLGLARERADVIVAQRLADPPLSAAVAEFLITPWRYHLVQTLLREGESAQRHVEARSLGDAVVEVDRLAAAGSGRPLAAHLLALEPSIVACLATSGLERSAAEQALAQLVRGLADPDTPRRIHPLPPSETGADDLDERRLWLVGGTGTLAHDPALTERMRQLQPGDWVQLTDADGKDTPAKVAWISPLTTRALLVNRQGLRVLLASAEDLAALAGRGQLTLVGDGAPFEVALQHVRQRLAHGAR